MPGTHPEHEDFPWVIAVVDHPARTESTAYVYSRRLMQKLVATTPDWVVPGDSYQDHHGGSVWVKDDAGWLCLQLPLGIEWSAQFCADPAKVDRLRRWAARVVAGFPTTLAAYRNEGYHEGGNLLATEITDAAGVAAWTDSIFNASMPLPAGPHSGVLPTAAGYHHYPKPIVDIDHFRRDDFTLFVTDANGLPAVVVPVGPPGAGDGRTRLLGAHPDSPYARRLLEASRVRHESRSVAAASGDGQPAAPSPDEDPDVLHENDPLSRQAFANQVPVGT